MTTTLDTDLDRLLAPLDDVARCEPPQPPTRAGRERAYALALLSAELNGHAGVDYLIDYLDGLGVEPGDAKTIARALSSAVERIAMWTLGAME